ncbi:MAG TPA: hypothetical protein VEC99_17690, partial [Clostridia bacterium]|nr:hypothetical protein [Clostridia bacterium]
MNALLQWLASEAWAQVVEALLHTLWIGGLAVAGLFLILRKKTDPVVRYRWCVGALFAVVLGGVVAWAVLQYEPAIKHSTTVADTTSIAPAANQVTAPVPVADTVSLTKPIPATPPGRWTSWLALIWLGGVGAMLARAAWLVAE